MINRGKRFLQIVAAMAASVIAPTASTADEWRVDTAVFAEPTTRYSHGVLGDNVEYGQLHIRLGHPSGLQKDLHVTLPQSRVFEDIEPRLWDVTGDGAPEVVVVESSNTAGDQLAIYDWSGQKIAATPHIGTPNRWLAPVGAGDLDGDGHIEIAYVDRPHLAKTLRIWRFQNDQLTEIAQMSGFSNHRIGWDYILGGIKSCPDQPIQMVLPTGDWRSIVALQLDNEEIKTTELIPYSRQSLQQAMSCPSK